MIQVACALMIDGNRVLCAQRGPGMSGSGEWEFPGGKLEPGESSESCIKREILEELGLEIVVDAEGPAVTHQLADGRRIQLIPFLCRIIGGQLKLAEHAAVEWRTPDTLDTLPWSAADLGIVAWWKAVAAGLGE